MITVELDLSPARKLVEDTQGLVTQIPFALSRTLFDVATYVKDRLVVEMRTEFDRPTAWVLNSLYVRASSKADIQFGNIEAEVGVKDFATKGNRVGEILPVHIYGSNATGARKFKRSERRLGSYWVPGRSLKLDIHGNVPPSQMSAILEGLKLLEQPKKAPGAKTRRPKKKPHYFIRNGIVFQRNQKKRYPILPMLKLINNPKYRPMLNWEHIARQTLGDRFMPFFARRFAEAMKTAR